MTIHDPLNILHAKGEFTSEPPGSIMYSGHYKDVDISVEVISYSEKEISSVSGKFIESKFDLDKIYWVNIVGLHDIELIKKIGEMFSIHHMDLEDIVHVSKWSKIEEKDDYLFSIFKMVYLNEKKIIHEHVAIIQKDNLIITFQETPGDVFDIIRERLFKSLGRIREMSIEYLYYSLVDALIDQYFVIINHISNLFTDVEMKILENTKDDYDQVYYLRKELLYLIHAISPIRDCVNLLVKENSKFITSDMSPYYSDLIDHMNQVLDSLKGYKDMTNSLHEMQISNVSNDMNKTMMTLTIFSAIFIPMSFLAGVFGMNFTYMPGLTIHSSFYFFTISCFAIAFGMLTYFKIKKWF